MDVKSSLLLCEPIRFYNICNIYPIELWQYIKDTKKYNEIYFPFLISKDMISEEYKQYTIFEILLSNIENSKLLFDSLCIFCKTEDIRIVKENEDIKIYFDDNTEYLDKNNFDEFANIIILSGNKEKHKPEQIPVFETEEGYERWKKYEEAKKKYKKPEDEYTSLASMINIVQFGGNFYIEEDIIKKWSMYKLINSYSSLIKRDEYDRKYSQYLITGKPDDVKQHWSEKLNIK